jgi:hypothetical protein
MKLARIMSLLSVVLLAVSARAQTNRAAADDASLQKEIASAELKEQIRGRCLEGRRSICGKIVRIFPEGLLVEAGYTNLLREPLTKSWLVPGTVTASPAPNVVESREPGAICVGTVFLTDLPRGKPKLYDYVILAGYPTGETTYTTVGSIKKTARRFSANLDKAVNTILTETSGQPASGKEK